MGIEKTSTRAEEHGSLTEGRSSDSHDVRAWKAPVRVKRLSTLSRVAGAVAYFTRMSPLGTAGGLILVILVLAGVLAPLIAPYDPVKLDLTQRLLPPSSNHLFGTDHLGRDVFSRTLYGARISLMVGLVVVSIGLAIGTTLGMLAGYVGNTPDQVIMRVADMFLAFPSLVLAMALVAALGPDLLNVMLAISITSWPGYSRLVRGMVLSIKEVDYVDAARAIGVRQGRILVRHILPNAIAPVFVAATLNMGVAIIVASGLSFIGFGVQPPTPEWGAMVSDGRTYMNTHFWIATFPGLAILVAVTGFNLFGDGLRDALDPRLRGRI